MPSRQHKKADNLPHYGSNATTASQGSFRTFTLHHNAFVSKKGIAIICIVKMDLPIANSLTSTQRDRKAGLRMSSILLTTPPSHLHAPHTHNCFSPRPAPAPPPSSPSPHTVCPLIPQESCKSVQLLAPYIRLEAWYCCYCCHCVHSLQHFAKYNIQPIQPRHWSRPCGD